MVELVVIQNLQLSIASDEEKASWMICPGDLWAVKGDAKSGKTTLMKTLLGMVTARQGEVRLFGESINACGYRRLHELRRNIGVMFAQGGLLGAWTVRDNLMLPLVYHGSMGTAEASLQVEEKLAAVGLPESWLERQAVQLSFHQMQAVALVRVMVARPQLIVVDGVEEETLRCFAQSPFYEFEQLLDQGSAMLVHSVCDLEQWWARKIAGFLHMADGNITVVQTDESLMVSSC